MNIQIGDIVKGISNGYGITNTKMTRGLVTGIRGVNIQIKVLEHADGKTGEYVVTPKDFEIIGHLKPFDRAEVLELLKEDCKQDILEYYLIGADLSGADLRGADLSGADLRGADLRGANLKGADLRGADLRGADLRGVNLRGVNLRGADLTGANLSGANLSGANLKGVNLRGADLSAADLDYSCYPLWCGSLHLKADKRLACQLAYHLCSLECDDEEYIEMRNSILDFANQFHRVGECGNLEKREI